MKKILFVVVLVMVFGFVLVVDGGYIDFNGLVQFGICKVGVVDVGMYGIIIDGVVILDIVNVIDNFVEVNVIVVGLLLKEFMIFVNCESGKIEVFLIMGFVSYVNISGILNNNMNIIVNGIQLVENVNIVVYNMINKFGVVEIKQVYMNNFVEKYLLILDVNGDG